MENVSNRILCSVLLLTPLTFIGCGPPDYYTMKGKVTHDGEPMPFVQITLMPDSVDAVRPPLTVADKDGYFEMKSGSNRGVPPGTYTVHIEDPSAADGGKTVRESDPLYEQYFYVCERYSPSNSDLKYEADSHQSDYELKLDTAEYTSPKVPLNEVENTTDMEEETE